MLDAPEDAVRRRPRRVVFGWIAVALGIVLIVVLGILPAPYVIEAPGPVFNTVGVDAPVHGSTTAGITVSRHPSPVISVTGHPSYRSRGGLYMLTVSSYGRPGALPNWVNVVSAWFRPSDAVVPVASVYPPDSSVKAENELNTALMQGSQEDAVAAAFTHLNIPFTTRVTVAAVSKGLPAAGVLRPGDQIVSVGGAKVTGVSSLRDEITANGTSPTRIGILRKGLRRFVTITPKRTSDGILLGVGVTSAYTFPFPVTIRLREVGGPSAGMMFTLGVIDTLTPGGITGGATFAGTGTIDPAGSVGAIGGIVQKMAAARSAGARYFLAPKANCSDVRGHVPAGLRVFAVSHLDDALRVVRAVRTDGSLAGLPSCATH